MLATQYTNAAYCSIQNDKWKAMCVGSQSEGKNHERTKQLSIICELYVSIHPPTVNNHALLNIIAAIWRGKFPIKARTLLSFRSDLSTSGHRAKHHTYTQNTPTLFFVLSHVGCCSFRAVLYQFVLEQVENKVKHLLKFK